MYDAVNRNPARIIPTDRGTLGTDMKNFSRVAWSRFPLNAQPDDLASPHFKFHELTISETAARLQIDNSFPDPATCRATVYLCRHVLEPVRAKFGLFSPNSVYRSQELEQALKKMPASWISTSQHTLGQACDIQLPDISNMDLAAWIVENLKFDQVILECHNAAQGKNSGWVHVSIVPPRMGTNRGNVLSYVMDSDANKYVYVDGLHETP